MSAVQVMLVKETPKEVLKLFFGQLDAYMILSEPIYIFEVSSRQGIVENLPMIAKWVVTADNGERYITTGTRETVVNTESDTGVLPGTPFLSSGTPVEVAFNMVKGTPNELMMEFFDHPDLREFFITSPTVVDSASDFTVRLRAKRHKNQHRAMAALLDAMGIIYDWTYEMKTPLEPSSVSAGTRLIYNNHAGAGFTSYYALNVTRGADGKLRFTR